MDDIERKNEIDIVKIRGELKLLAEKIDVIKTNDLYHIQKSVDNVNKILWAVGLLILAQLAIGIKMAIFG
jgi:hypothetical protein|tara:strand:- start:1357 stop:1566 length:210 start_codon:yes stop_codon:yes gene_type:complete